METMHAGGRRTLPPVPRSAAEPVPAEATVAAGTAVAAGAVPDDPAQAFVARLRASAADFAAAAGAASAVVREAVPPARHRRARCRVVLRDANGAETDLTFVGPTGVAGAPSRHGFDRQIMRWLAAGQQRAGGWLVPDPDALGGMAVDVHAWTARG